MQGAGHTEPGHCYKAKWKDDNGNTMTRDVAHPQVISKYFANSNVIDVFNQARQFDLRLEKHWVTEDGYFRLITTLFGIVITAVNCFRVFFLDLESIEKSSALSCDIQTIQINHVFEAFFELSEISLSSA